MRTIVLLTLCFFLVACEVATALLPAAKPVVERTVEVVRHPEVVPDTNNDGKISWGEKLAYILGLGAVSVAAYVKAHGAQKEVDQQWDKKLETAEKKVEIAEEKKA